MSGMETEQTLTVGQVAGLAGVTVRTLHHYDEIGLVVPDRTATGYRQYGATQIDRLQEVLFFRELGFGLDEIARIMREPTYERATTLRRQRDLLETKSRHLRSMLRALDTAIHNETSGETMNYEEKLEVFGDFDPSEYEEEVKERWGDSDAYRQSTKRTNKYTKEDWTAIQAEIAEIYAAFVALMQQGVPSNSPPATQLAERHRAHISRWFYDCSREIHAGLGQMYVADIRFTRNIDRQGEGLAVYMSEAIAASYA